MFSLWGVGDREWLHWEKEHERKRLGETKDEKQEVVRYGYAFRDTPWVDSEDASA
jgi:hypothetical protein